LFGVGKRLLTFFYLFNSSEAGSSKREMRAFHTYGEMIPPPLKEEGYVFYLEIF
jgi:hypothetical protein